MSFDVGTSETSGSLNKGTENENTDKPVYTVESSAPDDGKDVDPPGIYASTKELLVKYKKWVIGFIWILVTAYFIVSLALKLKTQLSDILPFIFLYVFITGRIAFYFFPTKPLTSRIEHVWETGNRLLLGRIPSWAQYTLGGAALLALALSVSLGLAVPDGESRLARMQSLLGIIVLTLLLIATSKHRKHINWRTVIVGYLMQFCLGCIVMKSKWGSDFFTWMADIASGFLSFSRYGASLLFGQSAIDSGAIAITMFPVIIFFASFVQVMVYLGGVQWVLQRMGWFFYKALGTSNAESIVASASPFIGQSENTLLVKDYLEHMTNSELHACMTAGFATISGSVFQSYVALGVDAKNLITACIMSIPCSLALSKIRYPERDVPLTRGTVAKISKNEREANVLHALGNGAATGIHLSLIILATIIGMVSLINAIDYILTWLGDFISIPDLTLELILGYLFYPLTWLLGVPRKDVMKVSQLLGLKLISNEFVAYAKLTGATGSVPLQDSLSKRALLIAHFSLAGFANTGSVAQVIAAVGSLAPSRKGDISRLAVSSCLTGALATAMSAAIVSMIF
ncbi:hypothetical protein LPJ66_008695 [Kickxella alabastrina]|uniref:Uncharacterized protein n=1 Tax=Kickxella alabastrina TaxID=61397 RepID=A0ACC1I608_9FUNG|nr:hypothetical protein LPJ66_008695 [Kickxella alabastrina]